MKFKATGLFLAIIISISSQSQAAPELAEKKNTIVGVISAHSKETFESQVLPILKEQTKACGSCEIRNLSPYNDKSEFDQDLLAEQLSESTPDVNFLIVHWNTKYHPELEPIVQGFKKMTANGVVIIGATGRAKVNENAVPLSKTVLAQVPDLVIIGELEERERLLNQGYFGPEMLTAIKPPKAYMGLGYSSLFFGSELANNWNRKKSTEWIAHFKATKSKSRRLWPALQEFFKR